VLVVEKILPLGFLEAAAGNRDDVRTLVNILLFPVRLVGRLIQAIGNVFRGSRA
jgi:hypothetical protein